jgi:two-component system, cell cycle sensor histidine kinase and response regulator CckA
LSAQILAFSSSGRKPPQLVRNLGDIIQQAVERMRAEYPIDNGLSVELSLGDAAIMTEYGDNQMDEVLDNILSNAMDAMAGKGILRIQLDMVSDPRNTFKPDLRYRGDFAKILISDTGPGIPFDIRNHLFEPFITTKKDSPTRRGAGLGLAIAYTIMKNLGGFVDLEYAEGQGTRISLFLPAIKGKTAKQPTEKEKEPSGEEAHAVKLAPRNIGRILLVDDEKPILKLFQMMIKAALPDREIDTAENGAEAMGLFRDNHHGIVVMDLHMPIMDGQAAFLEIEKLCAEKEWEMPAVIFCTGYVPSDLVHDAVSKSPYHCLLQKPIRGEVLVDAIKKRLPS